MTTTMHFGPEWMRAKQQTPIRPQPVPSPPPLTANAAHAGAPAPPGASSYSSLVTPPPPPPQEKGDIAHPFKYSKADMLRIWKDGGGRGALPIEVERWEGVVREAIGEPVGMKDTSDAEKKLFAASLNSELRRRQSSDYMAQGERPKLHHTASGTGSPLRDTFPSAMGRRRRGDSSGAGMNNPFLSTGRVLSQDQDQPPLTLLTRKQSWSSVQVPLPSPGLSSPRNRIGGGFDGILNGGDHWNGNKRRVSAGGSFITRGDSEMDPQKDEKAAEIKEEEEETLDVKPDKQQEDNLMPPTSSHLLGSDVNGTADSMENLSLNSGKEDNKDDVGSTGVSSNPPNSAALDLASVEWSYFDFSGNIQGPFRADTMQTWYDQQYFTDDLLMKRTHVDTEWTSVADLKRRVQGDKIFLSPLVEASAPPGLTRRISEPPFDPLAPGPGQLPQNPTVFDSPYQPIPQHSARSATLDSYLNNASNSSDSPSSSFGGGFGRSTDSPDPLAVGGRISAHNISSDLQYNGRAGTAGFSAGGSPAMSFMARRAFNDPSPDPAFATRGTYADTTPGRSSSYDSHGLNTSSMATTTPWQTLNHSQTFDGPNRSVLDSPGTYTLNESTQKFGTSELPFGATTPFAKGAPFSNFKAPSSHDGSVGNAGQTSNLFGSTTFGAVGSPASQREFSRLQGRESLPLSMSMRDESDMSNGSGSEFANGIAGVSFSTHGQTQKQSPALQYATQQHHPLPPTSTGLNHPFQPSPLHSPIIPSQQAKQPQVQLPARNVIAPPWGMPQDPPTIRPRPFAAQHPTVNNTIVRQSPSQRGSLGNHAAAHEDQQSQSKEFDDDGWGELTDEPQSLTFNHVSQHNQLQQGLMEGMNRGCAVPIDTQQSNSPAAQSPPFDEPVSVLPAVARQEPPHLSSSAKGQVSSAQPAVGEAPEPIHAAAGAKLSSAGTPTLQGRPAWSTEDEAKKMKPSGITVGLREIQDAEKKRQGAKRAVEKEKERAARAASQVPADEAPAVIVTWGLPTSQAGARNTNSGAVKEPAVASTTPTVPAGVAAWTSTGKSPAAKKTMKEIQQEEERRKKLAAKEKETVAQAAKRAYAESATKMTPSVQPSLGGAWTTVGASGKTSAPATPPVAARPTMQTQTSTLTPSSQSTALRPMNGTPTAGSPSAPKSPQVVKQTQTPTLKAEEEPAPPSPEFMKWLRDSLRGLNNSVQFEDIAQMLLFFPLDPDPSTVELIAETVYGASTTLDGRRFAAEFIAKRKEDAASRPKGASGPALNSKPVSLADVVKTQPKPVASEWGGFKVVKKKNKAAHV